MFPFLLIDSLTQGHLSNLSGLSGRFCFTSPCLTCFPSSDRMRSGCAVSGSSVTSTAYCWTLFSSGSFFICSLSVSSS
uniref:Uncharacterized protein n=1 Tax=Sparus aurata TaxID=8175 RepID=A0A671VCA7_SPAAU